MPLEKDLPLPETELPLPEKDLPLPEKEITSGAVVEEGKVVNDRNSSYAKIDNNLGGKAILIVILLILLYPIGVILMWFKTSWPKWVKFLLTIPLILGIIGLILGIFFLSKIASNDLTDKIPPSTIQVATPTPVDETAGWKTYADKDLTYSIEYPGDWHLSLNSPNNLSKNPENRQDLSLTGTEGEVKIKWVDSYGGGCGDENGNSLWKKMQIGGKLINVCDITDKSNKTERWSFSGIEINTTSHLGVWILASANTKSINRNLILKILSTFKFTEPDVLISAPPKANPIDGPMVACTMDAKLCPDGVTYVGREGPKCEFAKCPTTE